MWRIQSEQVSKLATSHYRLLRHIFVNNDPISLCKIDHFSSLDCRIINHHDLRDLLSNKYRLSVARLVARDRARSANSTRASPVPSRIVTDD